MGGELGTETINNIGLLVGSSGMSPPIFTLIGNDDFTTNFCVEKKVGVFEFSPTSRRDRVEI